MRGKIRRNGVTGGGRGGGWKEVKEGRRSELRRKARYKSKKRSTHKE